MQEKNEESKTCRGVVTAQLQWLRMLAEHGIELWQRCEEDKKDAENSKCGHTI